MSGKDSVREREVLADDKTRVGVSVDVFLVNVAGRYQVIDQTAQECDIGASANWGVKVGKRSRPKLTIV